MIGKIANNIKYYIIIENKETKYLKTKASYLVVGLMLKQYVKIKDRNELSFQKFLCQNGIECIYDGTFYYFNIDEKLNK